MIKNDIFEVKNSLEEVEELQNKYSFFDTKLSNISVTDDGSFKINPSDEFDNVPEKSVDSTVLFLQSFCDILSIPYDFSRFIPNDLFQTNVDRLKTENDRIIRI